ncbi:MAG: 30S ribosomal protein S1, partial [Bacilli bacterium]
PAQGMAGEPVPALAGTPAQGMAGEPVPALAGTPAQEVAGEPAPAMAGEPAQGMAGEPVAYVQGGIVEGTVVRVLAHEVYVDFGYTSEGVLARQEYSEAKIPSLVDVVSAGDRVRTVILKLGDADHPPALSRKAAVDSQTWDELRRRQRDDEVSEVRIASAVKGGLVADIEGLRAFLPASLVDVRFQSNLAPFVGQLEPVVFTELDEQQRRIILSRKRALEIRERAARSSRMTAFSQGQVVEGTVARVTKFGAFVDLGDVDGLLHVSEMSWSRVNRSEDAVRPGDRITVKILRVDPESGRLSLSMKLDHENPWRIAALQFHAGDIVEGTVNRLSSFGAFVEVAPGVEGLVHISQLAQKRVETPADAVSPGERVQVKILEFKPDEERMSLSIREAKKRKERPAAANRNNDQHTEIGNTTLGDLFGDVLREKFKL